VIPIKVLLSTKNIEVEFNLSKEKEEKGDLTGDLSVGVRTQHLLQFLTLCCCRIIKKIIPIRLLLFEKNMSST